MRPAACPTCGLAEKVEGYHPARVRCENCGEYSIWGGAERVVSGLSDTEKSRVAAILRERWVRGNHTFLTKDYYDNENPGGKYQLTIVDALQAFPKTVAERFDRVLLNVAKSTQHLGEYVLVPEDQLAFYFASTGDERFFSIHSLVQLGLLSYGVLGAQGVQVTPKGWVRIESLEKSFDGEIPDQAFVAMAFAEDLEDVFSHGIAPAAQANGYSAQRSDSNPKPGDIPDRILAEIRRSHFVVVDFTYQNRGAYYEAGFAAGLEKKVIYTCRADCFDEMSERDDHRPHFDIRNRYHLIWKDIEDLRARLTDLIGAVIGPPQTDKRGAMARWRNEAMD